MSIHQTTREAKALLAKSRLKEAAGLLLSAWEEEPGSLDQLA